MRIAFVSPRAWPAIGGMELYLRDLTRELATRHDVTVVAQGIDTGPRSALGEGLARPPQFAAFEDANVRVVQLRLAATRRAALAPLAAQAAPGLRRYAWGRARFTASRLYAGQVAPAIVSAVREADVVHVWGAGLLGAAGVRAARALGAPSVFTPFAHRGQWGDDPASAAVYRAADRVVALLHSDARLYRELGVPADRTAVCGVCSPGVPPADGEALRRRHGIDGPLVLFLGRRTPYKGADLLLEAAAALPQVTFAFVGPGDPVPKRAGARVLELGRVDELERAAWLDAADLLALPSANEIFPVSVLEAWSAGTPALLSDIEPLQELADGGGAVAVPRDAQAIADTIQALLADRPRLNALADAGRSRWRREFTPRAVAEAHERLYESALAREEAACIA